MGQHRHRKYSLTSLQIGDMQSYVSRLYLYLTCEKNKLFILVDNRPWLLNNHYRPALLWQLMVTKSRLSPFVKIRTRSDNEDLGSMAEHKTESQAPTKRHRSYNWLSVIDAARWQNRALASVKEMHHIFNGCVAFELAWDDVRGINYSNELQTDTCLALEVKSMIKKDFDSIEQALECIDSQCNGIKSQMSVLTQASSCLEVNMHGCQETLSHSSSDVSLQSDKFQVEFNPDNSFNNMDLKPLKDHLEMNGSNFHGGNNDLSLQDTVGKFKGRCLLGSCQDAEDGTGIMSETRGVTARAKLSDAYSIESKARMDIKSLSENSYFCCRSSPGQHMVDEPCVDRKYFMGLTENNRICDGEDAQSSIETVVYKDVLIIFKFSDPWLPFELKQIITSDLRLLRLLESGLPSWVIFFQSYPIFCQLYCPWMCPLAKTLYILISIITVLIGFYDLYKNVPVLKATAARLCGPLFDWIEAWEMISRLKYLGTMLFLQNFEKAFRWSLTIIRAAKQLTSLLTRPMVERLEPLAQLGEFILPFWTMCVEAAWDSTDGIWIAMSSTFSGVASFMQIVIWPFVILLSFIWSLVTAIMYPIASAFWELLITPIRLFLMFLNYIAFISSEIIDFGKGTWQTLSGTFQIISATENVSNTNSVPVWRALWNDLFSQVFRAVRSIVNGFAAFFIACNKHRLSIYNHLAAFRAQLADVLHIRRSSRHILGTQKKKRKPPSKVDREYRTSKSLDYPQRCTDKNRHD